jgi:hypothetical protein
MAESTDEGINVLDALSGDKVYVGIRRLRVGIALVVSAASAGDVEVVLSEADAATVARSISRVLAAEAQD